MRAVGPLFILLVIGFSTSAPLNSRHEAGARKFFGSIVNNAQKGNHGAMFDEVFAKIDVFFPGFVTDRKAIELRETFLDIASRAVKIEDRPPTVLVDTNLLIYLIDAYVIKSYHMESILKDKKQRLDQDALLFLQNAFSEMPNEVNSDSNELISVYKEIRAFKTKFNALSDKIKASLRSQFAIFDHLDEFEALFKVLGEIYTNGVGLCENLPGYEDCDKLMGISSYSHSRIYRSLPSLHE